MKEKQGRRKVTRMPKIRCWVKNKNQQLQLKTCHKLFWAFTRILGRAIKLIWEKLNESSTKQILSPNTTCKHACMKFSIMGHELPDFVAEQFYEKIIITKNLVNSKVEKVTQSHILSCDQWIWAFTNANLPWNPQNKCCTSRKVFPRYRFQT